MTIVFSGLIILAIVIVLIILGRRLPDARKIFNYQVKISEPRNNTNIKKFSLPNFNRKLDMKNTLEEAEQLFKNKKYSEAEKIYIEIAAKEPKNPKIYNRLGVLYLEEDNFQDAKSAFQEAIKFDDKVASRWYNLGLAQMSLQEFRNSLEAFEKAYKLDKKNEKYAKAYREAKLKLNKFLEKK